MKSTLTKTITAIFIGLFTFLSFAPIFNLSANAEVDCSNTNIPESVREAAGCFRSENTIPSVVQGILNAVISIIGIVAVIYIIIGGVNYMTSAGDADKIKKAKNTIKFAVIGLIIVIFSFVIVNWTIAAIGNATN